MPRGDGYGGRAAQAWVARVLDTYGRTCHLCRHGMADSADHLHPRSTHPELMYNVTNGRPVHHQPCPACGKRCNIARKDDRLTAPPPVDSLRFFERNT